MIIQILLNHSICNDSCAPNAIAYCLEITSSVLLSQNRKLFLQQSETSDFQPFYQITNTQGRRIFDMHVNVIFAYYSFQDMHILTIAYLTKISRQRFCTSPAKTLYLYFVLSFNLINKGSDLDNKSALFFLPIIAFAQNF